MKLFWVRHRKNIIIFPIFDCLRFFFNVQKVYDLVLFEFFFKQKILTSNTLTVDLQIKKENGKKLQNATAVKINIYISLKYF